MATNNKMQTASVLVAVGGDRGNSVPKDNVTPAEVAVLRAVHGDDAVFDIVPGKDIERGNRQELERLVYIYGSSKLLGTDTRAVPTLFPGAGARVFTDFEELDLSDEYYKAETRATPKKSAAKSKAEPEAEDEFGGMTKAELVDYAKENEIDIDEGAKKADILEAIRAAKTVPEDEFGGALS